MFGETRLEGCHQVADAFDEGAPGDGLGFVEPSRL
jgi:hypothetical protein